MLIWAKTLPHLKSPLPSLATSSFSSAPPLPAGYIRLGTNYLFPLIHAIMIRSRSLATLCILKDGKIGMDLLYTRERTRKFERFGSTRDYQGTRKAPTPDDQFDHLVGFCGLLDPLGLPSMGAVVYHDTQVRITKSRPLTDQSLGRL